MFDRFRKIVATIDDRVVAMTMEKAMGTETMTAVEQQAENTRKADLKAQMLRMDDTELGLLAKRVGVEIEKSQKKEDLIAAIELKAEADAAAGRQALRDMEAEEQGAVTAEDGKRTPEARVVRALNAEFCREIPQEARGGSFEPDEDHPRFGGDYDVPNGKYRVTGSEWLFLIHKKKLQSAEIATEANKWGGKHVIAVD